MKNPTPSLVSDALSYISANTDRDTWARIAMAIKSEFPDEVGQELFLNWSAKAENFNSPDALSTWRSIKASGGVTIGTLFHLAKEGGFVLPKGHVNNVAIDSKKEPDEHRRVRDEQEKANAQAAHEQASLEANTLWDSSVDAANVTAIPYLVRKGVRPFGVRFSSGWLLVPLRDEGGKLWNVQRIAPRKTDGSPDKLFLKGGRKSGLWHMIGAPEAVLSGSGGAGMVILIAEGYATAATLHEATAYPVAVAFDAGNLARVAKALQRIYPEALLVLCGDDDRETQEASGMNPGRVKAEAAARAVRGVSVFPEGLPDGGTDFNDVHQHLKGGEGLSAVRSAVQVAIDAHRAREHTAQQTTRQRSKKTSDDGLVDRSRGGGPDSTKDRFKLRADGVWHTGIDGDGNERQPVWVCSRLEVQARTRDQDGGGWGYLLSFDDPAGNAKQWAMPARMLAGDGGEYRATLLGMGLLIATSSAARSLLTQYIQTRRPEDYAVCTDRVGWHSQAFVLPHETLGERDERIVFQSETPMENTFRIRGTEAQWRERVAAVCAGNSRLVFAVASAFAGPLMRHARMESGGFHFRGDSSSGKTTALKVAASVYGGPSFLQRWRTTDNALEATAAQHSDCLLILDELAQVDPKTAGECAYMLANEQSKARSSRTSAPRPRLTWRLLFLSAGELGLADHMAEGSKRVRTGQEVRMADIPADAGKSLGVFEELHGHDGGAALSRHMITSASAFYGAVGRAWILWLTEQATTIGSQVRNRVVQLTNAMAPDGASGQVERVAARFALVAVAGELATSAGLTGWGHSEAEQSIRKCFEAWLVARGGAGNGEVLIILRQVRRFLELNGDGRFSIWHRGADDHAPKTLNRAGFRRMLDADGSPIKTNSQHASNFGDRMPANLGEGVSYEYFVHAEVFRNEVCNGFDYRVVCRVLLEHECLVPDKGRSFDCKPRLPGVGPAVCYRIPPAIFGLDD